MEEEARVEIGLENRFKEALRKANERNNGCEPSVAECLAYDMQYVEKYVKQLELENEKFRNGEIVTGKLMAKVRKDIFGDLKDYIPKSKIKKNIEEYKAKGYIEIAGALQELLEEE